MTRKILNDDQTLSRHKEIFKDPITVIIRIFVPIENSYFYWIRNNGQYA